MRYLTDDLPGTGGLIKGEPEDFRVTEVPLYEASGRGEHVYLLVEKRGLGSLEAAERIARALGRPRRMVGLAGLKDARGLTRQWMSIEGVDPDRAARLDLAGIRILEVRRHRNRLKIGHLAGNRFEVRVRGCVPGAVGRARAVLDVLGRRGVPNWFDRQRFGRRGDNHLLGRALVLGQHGEFCARFLGRPSEADPPRIAEARRRFDAGDLAGAQRLFRGQHDAQRVLQALVRSRDAPPLPSQSAPGEYTGGDAASPLAVRSPWIPGGPSAARAARALPKQLARLLVSAYQSDLFNACLERRLADFDRLEAGDLAYIHAKGAVFLVERPQEEQPRADRFEISPSGPIVGHRVRLAEGRPGEIERAVLSEKGAAPADFERVKALRLRGERRPLRAPLGDATVEADGEDLVLAFALPPGAYATVVLAEVMKAEPPAASGHPVNGHPAASGQPPMAEGPSAENH